MRNYTILAVILSSLFIFNYSYAVYEISDGSVKALYHLEDEVDSSGNGLNLTNSATEFIETNCKLGGSCAYFDNVNDYLNNSTVTSLKVDPLTIAFWVKGGSANIQGVINQRSSGQYKFSTGPYSNKINASQFTPTAGASRDINGTITITDSAWHLIVLEMSSSSMKAWVDNTLDASSTSALAWGSTTTAPFRIGKAADGDANFTGYIDEVIVKSGVMDTSTRDGIYNSGAGNEVCVTEDCDDPPVSTYATSSLQLAEEQTLYLIKYILEIVLFSVVLVFVVWFFKK